MQIVHSAVTAPAMEERQLRPAVKIATFALMAAVIHARDRAKPIFVPLIVVPANVGTVIVIQYVTKIQPAIIVHKQSVIAIVLRPRLLLPQTIMM